jgi:hypothetical protein
MMPFPESYVGYITRIDTNIDGKQSSWYWAKRDGVVTEVINASSEVYLEEFPGRPLEVTPWPYPTDNLPTH